MGRDVKGCGSQPGCTPGMVVGDTLRVVGIGCEARSIRLRGLTPGNFRPFGQVLMEPAGAGGADIETGRFWADVLPIHHDAPTAGIIRYHPRPLVIQRMERHPGSGQTFVSLSPGGALVAVAPDRDDEPDIAGLQFFLAGPGEGFRLAPGTWHASPFPLGRGSGRFLVIMKPGTIGEGTEWHRLRIPLGVEPGNSGVGTSGP